jgi:hypothetical protein
VITNQVQWLGKAPTHEKRARADATDDLAAFEQCVLVILIINDDVELDAFVHEDGRDQ